MANRASAAVLVLAGVDRGSGFLVESEFIFTCAHVVSSVGRRGRVTVCINGLEPLEATVENMDAENDCALLKLDRVVTEILPIPLATGRLTERGNWHAIGYPSVHDRAPMTISGEIQYPDAVDRYHKPSIQLFSHNMTAGAMPHGMSGSAVVVGDSVVGILKSIVPDSTGGSMFGVIFACPARFMAELLPRQSSLTSAPPPPGAAYDARMYLRRGHRAGTEDRALQALSRQGKHVLLWGPDLSGKTWSIAKIAAEWKKKHGGRILRMTVDLFGRHDADDLATFLSRLAHLFSRQLGKNPPPPIRNDGLYSPEYQLTEIVAEWLYEGPLLLCIDRAENLLDYEFCDGFLQLLRSWAEDSTEPWQNVRMMLGLSTMPKNLTRTLNVSPLFNVMEAIELEPLTMENVQALCLQYGLNWTKSDLAEVLRWLGGNPYLLRVVFNESALRGVGLSELRCNLPEELRGHLRHLAERIDSLGIKSALQRVGTSSLGPYDKVSETMRRLGIVRIESLGVQLSCELYRELLK